MPQFDFFIWFSLSLSTIFTFQFLYYFLLYFILAPFSNIQKTLIKLYKSQFFFFNKINSNFFILNSVLRKIYNI